MLKYWLWLTTLPHIDGRKISYLLRYFGSPEEIYYARKRDFEPLEGLSAADAAALSLKELNRAEQVLEQCQRLHMRTVTVQDAEYPAQLRALDDAPGVLYVRGQLSMLAVEPAIGIVGTRGPSAYGLDVAARFGYHLSKGGMTVVSGMAAGIDAAAHHGALRTDSPTVAVLGGGADVIYPAQNETLYHDIVARGAVISEYPPGTQSQGGHFPRRNRIISGLSLGVLIVEAPKRSGALITAEHAFGQGRDVYAVPGGIDAPNSAGCNALIREYATLVTKPGDILEEYEARYQVSPAKQPEDTPPMPLSGEKRERKPTAPAPPAMDLTPAQAKLMAALARGAMNTDALIQATGLTAQETLTELTMLELAGVIRSAEQGVFQRV
ncbi:MAG: DNA-processing protein DprA [Oscillospiraceae bacterium]|nr:DNA-processing protein DprA [Oscillospiraceae bacterium]